MKKTFLSTITLILFSSIANAKINQRCMNGPGDRNRPGLSNSRGKNSNTCNNVSNRGTTSSSNISAATNSGESSIAATTSSSSSASYRNAVSSSTGVRNGLLTVGVGHLDNQRALDFLIQDVCVNAKDEATNEDPATCSRKRNLKVGEDIPYVLLSRSIQTDKSTGAVSRVYINRKVNNPLLKNLSVRVVSTWDWAPFRSQDYTNDGYDIFEAEGEMASATMTQLPYSTAATTFWGSGCEAANGWAFFPTFYTFGGWSGNIPIKSSTNGKCTDNNWASAPTTWKYYGNEFPGNGDPEAITYTSGRKLNTIHSVHSNEAGTALEIYFFTKEYGLTRYENWNTAEHCVASFGNSGACDINNRDFYKYENGILVNVASTCTGAAVSGNLIRSGCVDYSFAYALPSNRPLHAYGTDVDSFGIDSRNILQSGDFSDNPKRSSWKTLGSLTRSFKISTEGTKTDSRGIQYDENNPILEVKCDGNCSGKSIYQDASLNGVSVTRGGPYTYVAMLSGALMKASKEGAEASILITVGTQNFSQKIKLGTDWTPVRFNFDLNFSVNTSSTARFEIKLHDNSATYTIDETFLAVMPTSAVKGNMTAEEDAYVATLINNIVKSDGLYAHYASVWNVCHANSGLLPSNWKANVDAGADHVAAINNYITTLQNERNLTDAQGAALETLFQYNTNLWTTVDAIRVNCQFTLAADAASTQPSNPTQSGSSSSSAATKGKMTSEEDAYVARLRNDILKSDGLYAHYTAVWNICSNNQGALPSSWKSTVSSTYLHVNNVRNYVKTLIKERTLTNAQKNAVNGLNTDNNSLGRLIDGIQKNCKFTL